MYQIIGALSDRSDADGHAFAKQVGLESITWDFEAWRSEIGVEKRDLAARQVYFSEVLAILEEQGWQPDFLILAGFMLRLTRPVLTKFDGKIINVHPAWLSIMADGKRKYTGLNVVARAMEARDPTGSTVHIVTDEPDMGPIVVESKALPYQPDDDPKKHQECMKWACDGPALVRALDLLISTGWPEKPWRGSPYLME